jgi:hypothetical protein
MGGKSGVSRPEIDNRSETDNSGGRYEKKGHPAPDVSGGHRMRESDARGFSTAQAMGVFSPENIAIVSFPDHDLVNQKESYGRQCELITIL